jgi:hypothetical protein
MDGQAWEATGASARGGTWLLDGGSAGRVITQQPSRLTGRGADDEGQMRRSEVLQVGQGKSSRKVELDQNFSSLTAVITNQLFTYYLH